MAREASVQQEVANLWLIIIGAVQAIIYLLTLIVVYKYTEETRKMQVAVSKQAAELSRQIRLSIQPAFTARLSEDPGPVGLPPYFQLFNVGNGTAVEISIDQLTFSGPVYECYVIFEKVPLLAPQKSMIVPTKSGGVVQDIFGTNYLSFLLEGAEGGEVRDVMVRFKDVEGNNYCQTIQMGRGEVTPGPVCYQTNV